MKKYGLESLWIEMTKTTTMILLSILFGVFPYYFIGAINYSILRRYSGGFHAPTSNQCFILSIICGLCPIIFIKYMNIIPPINVIIFTYIIGYFMVYKLIPVQTIKRPIKSLDFKLELREKMKKSYFLVFIINIITYLILDDKLFASAIYVNLWVFYIFISPLFYKLYNQPYNYGLIDIKEIRKEENYEEN